jgi:hypothetical protein
MSAYLWKSGVLRSLRHRKERWRSHLGTCLGHSVGVGRATHAGRSKAVGVDHASASGIHWEGAFGTGELSRATSRCARPRSTSTTSVPRAINVCATLSGELRPAGPGEAAPRPRELLPGSTRTSLRRDPAPRRTAASERTGSRIRARRPSDVHFHSALVDWCD